MSIIDGKRKEKTNSQPVEEQTGFSAYAQERVNAAKQAYGKSLIGDPGMAQHLRDQAKDVIDLDVINAGKAQYDADRKAYAQKNVSGNFMGVGMQTGAMQEVLNKPANREGWDGLRDNYTYNMDDTTLSRFYAMYGEDKDKAINYANEYNKLKAQMGAIERQEQYEKTLRDLGLVKDELGEGFNNVSRGVAKTMASIGATALSPYDIAKGAYDLAAGGGRFSEEFIQGNETPFTSMKTDFQRDVKQAIDDATALEFGDNKVTRFLGLNGEKVMSNLYSIGYSTAESAVIAGIGGGAGTVLLGTSAGMQTLLQQLQAGVSSEKALAQGLIAGLTEWATERYITLEKVLKAKNMKGLEGKAAVKQYLVNQLKAAGAEGSEEFFGSVIDTIADVLINQDSSEIAKLKAEYLASGDKNPLGHAILDKVGEATSEGLSGAISGLLMSAGGTAVQNATANANYSRSIAEAQKSGTYQDLLDSINATEYMEGREALTDKTDVKDVRRAYRASAETIETAAIKERLESQGVPIEDSQRFAEIIFDMGNDYATKRSDRNSLSPEARKVAEEYEKGEANWVRDAKAFQYYYSTNETAQAGITEQGAEIKKQIRAEERQEEIAKITGENVKTETNADIKVTPEETFQSASNAVGVSREIISDAYAKRSDEISAERYANATELAFRYGAAGMKLADVVHNIGFSMDSALSEAYKNGQESYVKGLQNNKLRIDRKTANVSYISNEEATKMGVDTVDIASLSDDQNAYIDALDTISKAYGVKMVLFESNGNKNIENGHYDSTTNSIYIDVSSMSGLRKYAILSTAAHELVHDFRRIAPEVYDALRQFVIDKYYGGSETAFNNAAKRIMQQRKLQGFELASPDDAVEELVAMSCEKVFDDPNMISRLAETLESKSTPDGQTMLDKFIEWVNGLIKRLKSALAKLTGIKANPYAEEMSTKDLEHIRDLFVQAAREIQGQGTEVGNDIVKAEPTDKMNINTEAKATENRTGLDGASLPLDGTLKDGDDHANKYSVKSSIEAVGFGYEEYFDNGVKKLRMTYNGETISVPTAGLSTKGFINAYKDKILSLINDNEGSPLNRLFAEAIDETMTKAEIEKIKDIYATYLATVQLYADDIDMGKEKLDAIWKWAGTDQFKAIKANSDKQYKVSNDMSSVCVKTEAVLNDISDYQVKSHRGVTPAEVMRIYFFRGSRGYQTPCPFCYVFSHWIRMGQLFETAAAAEDFYKDRLTEKGINDLDYWKAEYKRQAEWAEKNKTLINKAKNDIADIPDIVDEFCSLLPAARAQGNKTAEKKIVDTIDTLNERYVQAFNVVAQSDFKGWIGSCILKIPNDGGVDEATAYGDYKIVDRDILFDLRRVDELVREYPAMARFRTSKGSAGGKAVENYADNKFGEVISGIASNASATAVNTLLDDPQGFAKQFAKAQENAKKQMLRGGNRLFSWSDNRQDTGPDMLLNFIQLQAIGAGVQAYTKQIEGLELVAAMGGYINGSLVAKGKGYEVVDGKEQLVFSDRQGINAETTFELNKRYDRAGNILVGMNYNHIRIAMADDRIFFIIPWHRSSLSNRLLNRMMELVGESYIADDTIDKPTDYTAYQEEISFSKHLNGSREEEKAVASSIVKFWQSLENNNTGLNLGKAIVDGKVVDVKAEGNNVSESQYAYRELRAKVLSGKALTDTEETLVSNDYFLSQIRREMSDVGIDSWGIDDIDFIYPYEYWDHNSTFETADRNGLLYLEYCRRLGVAPKFSGFDKAGKANPNARFYNLPGYWKTLPDRRMYDREGNYQSVTQVKANKFLLDLITNEGLAERKEEYAKIGLKYETSKRADSKLSEEIYNTVNADMKFYGSKTGEREIGKFKSQQEDLDDYRKLSSGKPIKDYYTEGKNTAMNKTLANLEGTLGVKAKTRPGKSEHAAYEEAAKRSTKDLLTKSPTKAEMQVKLSTRDWFNDPDASAIVSNNPVLLAMEETIANAVGARGTRQYLMDAYKQYPELDYLSRIQEEGTRGKTAKEFKALIASINNAQLVDDIRWFIPTMRAPVFSANGGMSVYDYDQASKAAKYIHKICDERIEALMNKGGTDMGFKENQVFTLDEVKNLFDNLNTHAELAPLADKVFDMVRQLNIAYIAKTVGWIEKRSTWPANAGYWLGNSSKETSKTGLVVLQPKVFNSGAFPDTFKAETLLHESIHALTAHAITAWERAPWLIPNSRKQAGDVLDLISDLRKVLTYAGFPYDSSGKTQPKPYYGQTNNAEFLAEMSNPKFRELLRNANHSAINSGLAMWAMTRSWLKASNAEEAALSALDYLLSSFDMDDYMRVENVRMVKVPKGNPKYSIKDVAPVQPTNNWWKRTHTTEEAMALAKAYGVEMWKVNAESSEESNPTQMKDRNRGTTSTYRKVYDYLGKDYDGRILDASSGAGIGTEVGREMGYDVTDIEPYPGKTYTPQYQDYTALDDAVAAGEVEPFDFIISNAVLNVVPQDQRDGLVTHMGHMLAPGGRMFVHTRAKREIEELGKKAKNVHLGYGEAVESARGSYQYGFNQKELEAYLQDVLGSDYTVTDGRKAFNVNEATALVTKKSSDTKFSTKDSDGRTLTPEQQEYFKDSKVRDENGNLLVVYHGSHHLFTKFNGGVVGNFFASKFNIATGYAGNLPKSGIWNPAKAQSFENLNGYLDSIGVGLEHKNNKYIITEYDGETTTFGTLKEVTDYVTDQYLKFDLDNAAVYQVYLNITNPFVLDAKDQAWNSLPKNASGASTTDDVAMWAKEHGYDGVVFKNVIDSWRWESDDVYVTFDANQQKDVKNKNPTSNPDIRYSIKYDDDGNLKVDGASGFSGGGTIDYMLRDIVSHVFAAEYDEDIAAVYEKNNGIHAQRDMLDIKTLEDFKNLPDSLEYAHFSPVCTNFSLANNKRGEAQRDIDFAKRIAEMIEAKMPKCITIEQVPAYAKSKSCNIIRQALKRLGYTFDEGIYNSVDFGGDMSRDRFFMRAIKESSLPKIVKSGRTTKGWYDAVKDLIPSLTVSTTSTKAVNKGATKTTNYIPTWMRERLDAMGVNYKNPSKPLFIMGTGDANGLVRCYPGDEPIGSVKAKVGEPKIILTNGTVLDVSPRVIARLMGIPDGYELPKSKTRAFKILGNGVPGQLSRAMAVPLIEEVVAQEGYAPKYSTKDEDVIPYGGKAYSLKEDLSPNEYLASAVLDNIRKPEDRAGLEEYLNRHKELYQETTKLSNEITDLENKLRDSTVLSDSDRESIENRIKTLRKDVRENEKKMWDIVSKPRMQRIIEQQRATIQEYEEEMANAEEKSDAKIAELRARMDTKVRAEIDKRIAMRKRMLEQQRTQKSRYYYLPRIEKVTKELRKNLEKAPMPFRGPVADFLAALDTRTLDKDGNVRWTRNVKVDGKKVVVPHNTNIRKTNLLDALNGMSRLAGTTEEWLNKYNVDFNPEMVTWIDEMVEYLSTNRHLLDYYGDINLNTLSTDMLEGVYKMVRSLNTTLKNLTKSYTNKALDISEEAKAVMEFDGKLSHGAADANMAEKIFRWKNAQATTVYQRMGDGGWKMYKLLVKGQSKLAFNEQEIVDFAKSHWKPSDIRNWNDPKKAVAVEIGDEKVMMTPAQMMALYATSRDADGLRHLLEGGGFKLTSQAKGKRTVVDESRVMTEMDLANVINALNEYDPKLIKLTEEIQDFIGKVGAEWGNEVSVARFGYEQFGIENYFPLHTVAADFVGNVIQEDTEAGRFYSMLNRSFTKERTFKANNALVIDGIFDIFANHMSQMALYNAYALPVLDTARFMNWKVNESVDGKPQVTTLGDVWDKAFGKGEMQRYLTNLLDSIAGTKRMDAFEAFALAGLRLHNRVAVAANFRVAAQQPFSITRAFDEIDPKYFTIPKNLKALQEEMWRWSGIALWKHQGNYDTNIKGSLASQVMGAKTAYGQFVNDVSEKAMWLAEQGDDFTWAAIWNACKNYISATQPNLTGDAYMEAVTSKFEDVILLTQVVDTPLQKSDWMRQKSFLYKMTSSFKAEPTTSYNMLLRQYDRFLEAKQRGTLKQEWSSLRGPMLRAIGTFALTSVVNALVTAVIDAFRDDDDYETWLEKLKYALLGDYRNKEGWAVIKEFLGSNIGDSANILASLPWLADMFEILEGYDAKRVDLEILSSALNSAKSVWSTFTSGDWSSNIYKKIFNLVNAASKLSGLPVANMMRDMVSVWNTVFARIDSSMKLQQTPETKQSGYNAFYDALRNGDGVRAMQVVDEIASNEIDPKTAYTGVTSVIRKAYQGGKIDKDEALEYMMATNDYFDRGFDRAHIKNQVDGWSQE